MATKTEPVTGFTDLMCPFCGAAAEDGDVYVHLGDLRAFHCGNCSDDFDPFEAAQKMREQAAKWALVAEWVRLAAPLIERANEGGKDGESS